ncbi:uncharacterized protein LOC129716595 [Wyeomyia smithii]|uniref:uncharacterized protein LOC129716595 n=1 Tax=Wyeomyia smithii TaxID=174621 RepID=UPI002467B92A|nr:uncharacterized protein LOC129716595 [Wyeomyia smithii]
MLSLLLLALLPPIPSAGHFITHVESPEFPLRDAAIAVITEFYATKCNHIYIRRRATNPSSVFIQRDLIDQLLIGIGSRITVQLETYRAQVLNQSRAHNVFLVDDYEAFRRISSGMKIRTYDYTGNFLVLVSDSSNSSYRTVQAIMDDLWSHYIVNVGVLMAFDEYPGNAFYYTYFPFGSGYCEEVRPWLWKVFSGGRFVSATKEYYPAKLENFFGCPLKMATFDIPPFMMLQYGPGGQLVNTDGLDGIVVRVLSQRLNFTVEVLVVDPPDWGVTAELGQCTGAAQFVRDRLVNFTIGYWAVTYSRNRFMGSTFPYYTSLVAIAVPPGEPYNSLQQLYLPFKYIIWSCVCTILTLAVVMIMVINLQPSTVQNFVFGRLVTTPTLNTFNVFLGGALTRLPGRNFSRTLLAFWLFYGIIIRTSYMGSLFKFLHLQPNRTVLQLIPEYITAGYQIRMARNYSYLFDAFPTMNAHLQQTTLRQFYEKEILEMQLPTTRYILLAPIEMISHVNRALTKHQQMLRITRDRVYLSKLAIYSQRSAPVLQPFSALLGRFTAAGLIDQWASLYHQPVFLKSSTTSEGPRRLRFLQVQGSFELWTGGLLISVVVFAVESVTGWWKRRLLRKRRRVAPRRITFQL